MIRRTTAQVTLDEVVERARRLNEEGGWLYRVTLVAVFGSYLTTEKPLLGDLDLGVETAPVRRVDDAFIREEVELGYTLGARSWIAAVFRAREDILRAMRGRRRASLHDYRELVDCQYPHRVVYEHPDRAALNGNWRKWGQ